MWINFYILSCILVIIYSQQWNHHLVLDPDGRFHIWWNVSGELIVFQLQVATRGWIGFGLSPDGRMAGSDVVTGWVTDGKTELQDRFVDVNRRVVMDDNQNWILDYGQENSTHTTLKFHRPLVTCDVQDRVIDKSTIRLIYAYHAEDPAFGKVLLRHPKTNRGSKSVLLLQAIYSNLTIKNYDIWEIRSPNITIPHNKDTAYLCTVFRIPLVTRRSHVIRIEPMLQTGNEQFIIHMVIYRCRKIRPRNIRPYLNNSSYSCYYPDMPSIFSKCQTVFFSWATGGEVQSRNFPSELLNANSLLNPPQYKKVLDYTLVQSVLLPPHVGLPIGGRDGIFFLLEIHYDNPSLKSGVIDNSGFRIYYTTKLRKFDAMTLVVGSTYEPCVIIPPGDENFVVAGHGDPRCLSPAIPSNGIKIFAVLPHTHLLGKRFVLRHFRNKAELQPIIFDHSYDYNHQEYRYLQQEVTMLQNDHLVTECSYNSTGRNVTTFGGLGTKDEMCLVFILYYPKIARSFAISAPSCNLVVGLTGVEKVWPGSEILESPITRQNQTFIQHLATYPWQKKYINMIENTMRYSPHHSTCIFENSTRIVMSGHIMYPENVIPYQNPNICFNSLGICTAQSEQTIYICTFVITIYSSYICR